MNGWMCIGIVFISEVCDPRVPTCKASGRVQQRANRHGARAGGKNESHEAGPVEHKNNLQRTSLIYISSSSTPTLYCWNLISDYVIIRNTELKA